MPTLGGGRNVVLCFGDYVSESKCVLALCVCVCVIAKLIMSANMVASVTTIRNVCPVYQTSTRKSKLSLQQLY